MAEKKDTVKKDTVKKTTKKSSTKTTVKKTSPKKVASTEKKEVKKNAAKVPAKKLPVKKDVAKKEVAAEKKVATKKTVDKKVVEKTPVKTEKPVDTPKKDSSNAQNVNSGSPEYQIELLTKRINVLTKHLKEHAHDFHSRHGLLLLVGKRRGLLNYLQNVEINRYRDIIKKLNIRK